VQVFGRDTRELLIEALSLGSTDSSGRPQQGDVSLVQLRGMLAPFVLRRLKRDVLDQLTDKTTIVKRITMTAFQKQVYDGILLGHAARKDMLQLKHRTDDDAENILQDKVRSRVPSNPALASDSSSGTAKQGIVKPATLDLTATGPAASKGGAAECVSPFNKKLPRRDTTPRQLSSQREVVSLLSEDSVAAKATGKGKRGAKGAGSDTETASATSASSRVTASAAGLASAPSFPSEINLAAIAENTVNSADIDPQSAASLDEATASTTMHSLSASEASNLFTALRKAANHPLLLRVRYRDAKTLEKIAMITHSMGHFGNQCDYQRVRDEIDNMSDFDIHQLCLEYEALRSLQLDESALYDSPKMVLLRALLPQLQVRRRFLLMFVCCIGCGLLFASGVS
jgi:SNF2 family DNA or RNA helicase